jgi:hypothetical protein
MEGMNERNIRKKEGNKERKHLKKEFSL